MKKYENFPLHLLDNIKGPYLEAFLIAYEGWRRGLKLTWYNENINESIFNLPVGITGIFFSLENEETKHYFFRTRGDKVSNEGLKLARDKNITKNLLRENGVSVPIGRKFMTSNKEEIFSYAKSIGYPVVLKPLDSYMGKGVFCDIENEEELTELYNYYVQNYKFRQCMIEKQYYGEEHRIYVVGDEAVSCINRKQAFVVTDGFNSIRQLIQKKNKERGNNPYLRDKPIKIDQEIKLNLDKQKLDLDTIYEKDLKIKLRNISNLSKGGEPHEVSTKISQEIKDLAVKALNALPNVAHGGVDIIVDPNDNAKGTVIEINTVAEIVFHFYPLSGEPIQIPSKIIDYYFPQSINEEKSNFYFDYLDIKKNLDTGLYETLTIKNLEIGNIYESKIVIKVPKVTGTRMNSVRYMAIKHRLSGTIQKTDDTTISLKLLHNKTKNIEEILGEINKKINGKSKDIEKKLSETTFHMGGFYTIKND